MKPLRTRLLEARQRLGIPWEVLERDYLLSWVLAGMSQVGSLRDTLVFKGGTALKKCYFGDYRFSEDLDFSSEAGVPREADLEQAIRDSCAASVKLLEEYAPVDLTCERYTEREAHPAGQEAFVIHARMPWQRQPTTRVMVEITVDEKLLKPVARRPIIHEYGEPLEAKILVYALEEVVAEKLRAILQHRQKLEERGWSRSRARDYYDIWRILGTYKNQMDLSNWMPFLRAKCDLRNVTFSGVDDFFRADMLDYVQKTWSQWLGPLVPGLPSFEIVIGELRPQIASLVSLNRLG